MRHVYRILCVLCALCGSAFCLDRTAFTFTHYDLELRIDPNGHAIAARGKIRLRNDSGSPQRNLTLQISSSLTWRMIEENGKALQYVSEPYTSDVDHTGAVTEAVVTLTSDVPPKAEVELEVGYAGPITQNATRLTRIGAPAPTASHSDWDQIGETIAAVRGIGYVAWYPVSLPAASMSDNSLFSALDRWKESQRHTAMRVNFCWIAESNLTIVSNGRGEGVTRHALGADEEAATNTGCALYTFAPVATTVPTFAIAEYAVLTRPVINVYHLETQAPAAQEYALAAEKVLPFETEWFGAPKTKVQIVQLPNVGDAHFESGPILFTPLVLTERSDMQVRMIHQLVHASVTSPRPWIEEGLAHFAQALEREQQGGRAGALAYLQTFLTALQAAEAEEARGSNPRRPGSASTPAPPGLITSTDEVMYRVKAMYVWWMLRDMVGDAALRQAFAKYRAADDTNTAFMPQLLEQAAKRDLEWFFDDWLYRDRGLPDFRIDAVFPRATLTGGYVVTVTVANDGGPAAEVPVYVRAEGGQRQQKLLVKGNSKAVARVEVPARPTEAAVNDGSVPESNMNNNSSAIATKLVPE